MDATRAGNLFVAIAIDGPLAQSGHEAPPIAAKDPLRAIGATRSPAQSSTPG
jgi:hypothetical protein